MTKQTAQIKVPDRLEGEPNASPEQLQLIRQLVTGMALQGFRFDYRKLGSTQAAFIIEQLLAFRNAQGMSIAKANNVGCTAMIANFIRRLGTVVILLLFLGVIGGGVYLYFLSGEGKLQTFLDNLSQDVGIDMGLASEDEEKPDTDDTDSKQNSDLIDSPFFDSLKVQRNPDTNDTAGNSGSTGTGSQDDPANNDSPDTRPTPPVEPEPILNLAAKSEIREIEFVLLQLKDFSRRDHKQSDRQFAVTGIQRKLGSLTKGINAIQTLDPDLENRINAVITRYGQPQIDGQSLRDDIDSIREQINKLK